MTIRVTLSMLNNQFVRNLNENLRTTSELQDQVATGKAILNPSDDPVGITFAMRYRSEIAGNEQYQRNLEAATSFLENTDSALEQATNLCQRARELNVQALSDSNSPSSRAAIASEIDQLIKEFINIGNTNFNGKYIFNGQLTDVLPYDEGVDAPGNTITDNGNIEFEVGVSVRVPVNVNGNEVFGTPLDEDNIFTMLTTLAASMRTGDVKKMDACLGNMDRRMDKILAARATIGARANRCEFISTRLNDIELNLTKLQSEVEDANMGELITLMKTNESVYQASLATGAKIIQPTLIDFLR